MRLAETIVDGVAVSGDTSARTPKKPQNKKNRWSVIVLVSIFIIVLVVISGIVLLKKHHDKPKAQTYNVCNTPQNEYLLKDAVANFGPANVPALKSIITKIQQLPNYQKDPNCDYVVLTYYINAANVNNANVYLSKLEQTYNPKERYNKYLQPAALSVDSLKREISILQSAINQIQKRSEQLEIKQ